MNESIKQAMHLDACKSFGAAEANENERRWDDKMIDSKNNDSINNYDKTRMRLNFEIELCLPTTNGSFLLQGKKSLLCYGFYFNSWTKLLCYLSFVQSKWTLSSAEHLSTPSLKHQ